MLPVYFLAMRDILVGMPIRASIFANNQQIQEREIVYGDPVRYKGGAGAAGLLFTVCLDIDDKAGLVFVERIRPFNAPAPKTPLSLLGDESDKLFVIPPEESFGIHVSFYGGLGRVMLTHVPHAEISQPPSTCRDFTGQTSAIQQPYLV